MQVIYRKQTGLTPEEEHVISFLGSGNDDAVLEELHRRKLSNGAEMKWKVPSLKKSSQTSFFII